MAARRLVHHESGAPGMRPPPPAVRHESADERLRVALLEAVPPLGCPRALTPRPPEFAPVSLRILRFPGCAADSGGMRDDIAPVDAVRVGPGQFLLAAERVTGGLVFIVAGARFEVVGEPVSIGGDRFLATVQGPNGQLSAQLNVGHRVR